MLTIEGVHASRRAAATGVLMPSSSTCSLCDRSGPGGTSAPACESAALGLGAGLGAVLKGCLNVRDV